MKRTRGLRGLLNYTSDAFHSYMCMWYLNVGRAREISFPITSTIVEQFYKMTLTPPPPMKSEFLWRTIIWVSSGTPFPELLMENLYSGRKLDRELEEDRLSVWILRCIAEGGRLVITYQNTGWYWTFCAKNLSHFPTPQVECLWVGGGLKLVIPNQKLKTFRGGAKLAIVGLKFFSFQRRRG